MKFYKYNCFKLKFKKKTLMCIIICLPRVINYSLLTQTMNKSQYQKSDLSYPYVIFSLNKKKYKTKQKLQFIKRNNIKQHEKINIFNLFLTLLIMSFLTTIVLFHNLKLTINNNILNIF